MAGRWLFKTEPTAYSFAQLQRDRRTTWDGVKNAMALKYLRQVQKGDQLLIYHTGDEKAVVGVARAVSDASPDGRDASLAVVDIVVAQALPRPVPLAAIKANSQLQQWELARLPRLSVMPVSAAQWAEIERMAGQGTRA